MKKIDILLKGRKFAEKILGTKKRIIYNALEGAIYDVQMQADKASMDFEDLVVRLSDDNVNCKSVINQMLEKKEVIRKAEITEELLKQIKEELESEVDDKKDE